MAEQTVRLRKRSGGSGLTFEGRHYSWPEDGSVTEVPYDLAMRLLAIQDGDYSVEGEAAPARGVTGVAPASVQPASSAGLGGSEEGAEPGREDDEHERREVTEPGPDDEHAVTEPAPPPENDGSPVTPRPRAGTRTRRSPDVHKR